MDRLAQRIVQGDVPQALMNRKVVSFIRSLLKYYHLFSVSSSLTLSLFSPVVVDINSEIWILTCYNFPF